MQVIVAHIVDKRNAVRRSIGPIIRRRRIINNNKTIMQSATMFAPVLKGLELLREIIAYLPIREIINHRKAKLVAEDDVHACHRISSGLWTHCTLPGTDKERSFLWRSLDHGQQNHLALKSHVILMHEYDRVSAWHCRHSIEFNVQARACVLHWKLPPLCTLSADGCERELGPPPVMPGEANDEL